jgi:hypothetical protein
LVAVGITTAALATWPVLPPYVAAIGWTVGGTGMGMAMASLSVLVLELSRPGDQGANSAALQLSDALGSMMLIGAGGALFARLHGGSGDGGVFLGIYLAMAAVAALGVALAPRVRPERVRSGPTS